MSTDFYFNCRICGNEKNNKLHTVREMMFGTGEKFLYAECSRCGCLQIHRIPENLSAYYPSNYYSHTKLTQYSRIKRYAVAKRDRYLIFGRGLFGKTISRFFLNRAIESLSLINIDVNSRILDVGCGAGELLLQLSNIGFSKVMGVDPYIENNISGPNNFKIVRGQIADVKGEWDVVMFHHSFEHISEPFETLLAVKKILSANGYCLLRIPTVSSYAWRHYGVDWVQIDAPRHLFLYSKNAIEILCEKLGLKLCSVVYDSFDFQFWGSEQHRKNIPMLDRNSYYINKNNSSFSIKQINAFKRDATLLNTQGDGDQAIFILQKITDQKK